MFDTNISTLILSVIFGPIVTLICLFIFRTKLFYLATKGINLATKEDLVEITEKIESVKMLYQEYGFRYKKEYEILCEISAALVVLRDCIYDMRPEFGYGTDPNLVDAKIIEANIKKEKLEFYFIKHTEFYLLVEQNRPFYSDDVYKVMVKITVLGPR